MLITEYRVSMPMTVAEYQVAQLYCVAETCRQNTGHDEGIQVVTNEVFTGHPLLGQDFASGQYTYKIYHLASKVPGFVSLVIPRRSLAVHEEAWNAFPYCRTILTNSALGNAFQVTIESMHLDDRGNAPNAHRLPPALLERRRVVHIDIAAPPTGGPDTGEFASTDDPANFKSTRTGRGPLKYGWRTTAQPVMTCYKLVKAEFRWFGLQSRVENWIHSSEQKLFLQFHRKMFCSIDQWHGMTLADARAMEEQVQRELAEVLQRSSATPHQPTSTTDPQLSQQPTDTQLAIEPTAIIQPALSIPLPQLPKPSPISDTQHALKATTTTEPSTQPSTPAPLPTSTTDPNTQLAPPQSHSPSSDTQLALQPDPSPQLSIPSSIPDDASDEKEKLDCMSVVGDSQVNDFPAVPPTHLASLPAADR